MVYKQSFASLHVYILCHCCLWSNRFWKPYKNLQNLIPRSEKWDGEQQSLFSLRESCCLPLPRHFPGLQTQPGQLLCITSQHMCLCAWWKQVSFFEGIICTPLASGSWVRFLGAGHISSISSSASASFLLPQEIKARMWQVLKPEKWSSLTHLNKWLLAHASYLPGLLAIDLDTSLWKYTPPPPTDTLPHRRGYGDI